MVNQWDVKHLEIACHVVWGKLSEILVRFLPLFVNFCWTDSIYLLFSVFICVGKKKISVYFALLML